jgi:ABC-type transporter Mla maintaining outer membrane lipid asymmetry ATPase subunit MlaF
VTAPLILVQDLRLKTGSEAFSLAVPAGHTAVVLGDEASGIGRLGGYALGLERPLSGSVALHGTVIGDLPFQERLAFRRRVGYLPAGDGLLHNLSVRDNVALPLRFGSDAAPEAIDGRVSVMLTAVRIGAVAGRRPAQVTDEERRRAALARALAFDPPVLVLERPFDGLSARAAGELLEFARGGETAAGARRTILVTGHDLPVVVERRVERIYRLERSGALAPAPA